MSATQPLDVTVQREQTCLKGGGRRVRRYDPKVYSVLRATLNLKPET